MKKAFAAFAALWFFLSISIPIGGSLYLRDYWWGFGFSAGVIFASCWGAWINYFLTQRSSQPISENTGEGGGHGAGGHGTPHRVPNTISRSGLYGDPGVEGNWGGSGWNDRIHIVTGPRSGYPPVNIVHDEEDKSK